VAVALFYFGLRFMNAPLWPAEGLVMKENFRPETLDASFRLLSISSRLAAFTTMASFGALLEVFDWQTVSQMTAGLGFIAAVAALLFLPKPKPRPVCLDGPPRKPILQRLAILLQQPWYRWALLANAGTTGVTNMTLLISSFFSDTLENADDFQILLSAAAFPAGLLICLLGPGHYYKSMDHTSKTRTCE
jgi:hypothetical protein